jgi:hypothetical protein
MTAERTWSRWRKWWVAIAALTALSVVIALTIGVRVSRQAEPRLREELERWLSARLNSDVQLASLELQLRPTLRLEGRGLVLRLKGRPDLPPFISIERVWGTGGFTRLRAKRVTELHLEGVVINVPPGRKADLESLRQAGAAAAESDPADGGALPEPPLIIDRLVAASALLVVMPRDPSRDAHQWDIRDLVIEPFSLDTAAPFSATVDTPLPGDRARIDGHVGPFPQGDFDQLPIAAEYTFAGDAGSVPGLDGRLDATGAILGVLERLATNGTVTSPAIGLRSKDAGRLAMSTTYEAVLDGTNGDLFLTKAATTLADSTFETAGKVLRVKGQRGRHVSLTVKTSGRADVADVMRLLVDGAHPPLHGRLALDGSIDLPPGKGDVLDRLAVDGSFRLARLRFANAVVQDKVDELSRRGQGKPSDATIVKVPSDMQGRVRLRQHQVALSAVLFTAPGATIDASGSYGIDSERLRFRGVAKLDVSMSRTQSGARRFLLRPIDPLFRKRGAGTRLVVDVRGTRAAPVVDLDMGASLRGRR